MSFNLVDLVKGQFGGPALGQLGTLLGEDNNKTEAALGAAVPGLLSGLTSAANADGGASLFDAVNKQDDSMLDNIGGLLTGGNSSSVMDQGSNMLSSILGGGAAGGLASAVAGLTGIGGRSSSGMMGLLMPIVLGIVKRKVFGGGGFSQNAGGLLSLLNGQKDNVQAAMPSGFQNQLQSSGFMDQMSNFGGGLSNAAGNVAGSVGNAASNTVGAVGNVAGNAAGAVGNAASGAAGAAGNVAGSVGNAASNTVGAVGNVAGNAAGAVGNAASGAAGAVGNAASGAAGAVGNAASGVAGAAGNVAGGAADAVGNVAGGAAGAVGSAASGVGNAAGNAASGGGGFLRKFLPIAAIAAIALFALKLCTGGGTPEVPDVSANIPAVEIGDVNVGDEIGSIFSGATSAVSGITDADSATAAVPALEDVSGKVDGLAGMWDKIPEAGRGPMSGLIGDNVGKLQPLIEKANELPGVGAIIGPVVGPLMEKLQGMQ